MNNIGKPCLVETGQGFSVLYHNRHLYSRHDPARTPRLAAERLNIKPETLVICFSPLLGYGLPELLAHLPHDCMVLALEADPLLFSLSQEHIPSKVQSDPRFSLIYCASIAEVLRWFESNFRVPVRRCLSLDCSGGASLYRGLYQKALASLESFIATWWKNRMTLMILGRNFHRNLLRNLSLIPTSFILKKNSVDRPIVVVGAGPSLDSSLSFLSSIRSRVFILSVDTALSSLRDVGIKPDAVVILESQFWIEQALYGFTHSGIPVFGDLVARTRALTLTGGPITFFSSRFDDSPLLVRLEEAGLLPPTIPRLGSVGLVALYLARLLAFEGLPIFFTGLDFSQGAGYSHSRGAPWPERFRRSVSRLLPPGPQLFPAGSFYRLGKLNRPLVTTPILSGYAQLCQDQFGSDNRCFDIGQDGLDTGCHRLSQDEVETLLTDIPFEKQCSNAFELATPNDNLAFSEREAAIRVFLQGEYSRLKRLRDILTGALAATEGELIPLIEECSYLYSHFPDAHRVSKKDQSFLNRIRVEAEVFLKTITAQSGMDIDQS